MDDDNFLFLCEMFQETLDENSIVDLLEKYPNKDIPFYVEKCLEQSEKQEASLTNTNTHIDTQSQSNNNDIITPGNDKSKNNNDNDKFNAMEMISLLPASTDNVMTTNNNNNNKNNNKHFNQSHQSMVEMDENNEQKNETKHNNDNDNEINDQSNDNNINKDIPLIFRKYYLNNQNTIFMDKNNVILENLMIHLNELKNETNNNNLKKIKLKECLQMIIKLLTNIIKNPSNEKFRQIKKSNAKFQSKIAAIQGYEILLKLCNWDYITTNPENPNDGIFIYANDDINNNNNTNNDNIHQKTQTEIIVEILQILESNLIESINTNQTQNKNNNKNKNNNTKPNVKL